jgi:peroxiredoxin
MGLVLQSIQNLNAVNWKTTVLYFLEIYHFAQNPFFVVLKVWKMVDLSDFKSGEFGKNYGLEMTDIYIGWFAFKRRL